MGVLNEVAKFIFLFKCYTSNFLVFCLLFNVTATGRHKVSAEHLPLNSLSMLPCSKRDIYHQKCPQCLTAASRSHRRGHLILYSDAWLMQMGCIVLWKKKISNDCLLCLCVAMTVKPLFDHPQWILLSQSCTSTPTVINICCYSKESPPIYNWLLN